MEGENSGRSEEPWAGTEVRSALRQRNAGAAADTQAQIGVSLPTQRDEDRTSIPALVKTG